MTHDTLIDEFKNGEDTVYGVEPKSLHKFIFHHTTVQKLLSVLIAHTLPAPMHDDGKYHAGDGFIYDGVKWIAVAPGNETIALVHLSKYLEKFSPPQMVIK